MSLVKTLNIIVILILTLHINDIQSNYNVYNAFEQSTHIHKPKIDELIQ